MLGGKIGGRLLGACTLLVWIVWAELGLLCWSCTGLFGFPAGVSEVSLVSMQ
jgi:hypothetical protein